MTAGPATPQGGAAAFGVHPRFRRRRIEVTREEGRRRLRILVASLAVAAAVAGVVGATRSPLLDVDGVDLRGASHTSPADVAAATGLDRHPLMVEVDPTGVARRVEALPWVLRARVSRSWPGTVRVDVVERVAVAVVPAGAGRWALADGSGRILAVGPERPPDLPLVPSGQASPAPGSTAAPARGALRLAAALPPAVRSRVSDVVEAPGSGLELRLRPPGGIVRLGAADQLEAKLAAVRTVLEEVDLTGLNVLDVRVPASPVLTRR